MAVAGVVSLMHPLLMPPRFLLRTKSGLQQSSQGICRFPSRHGSNRRGSQEWTHNFDSECMNATDGDKKIFSSSPDFIFGDGRHVSGTDFEHDISNFFIEDQLSQILNDRNTPVRQIVFLSDGTKSRSYRFKRASPTLIFDVSPGSASDMAFQRQFDRAVGCLVKHVRLNIFEGGKCNDEDWGASLLASGYRGDLPSMWVIQVPRALPEECLQGILARTSYLVKRNSMLVGELPDTSVQGSQQEVREYVRKLFMRNGFDVITHSCEDFGSSSWQYAEPVSSLSRKTIIHKQHSICFVSRQQRLSDAQVAAALEEMERAEEAGDEEGFED